MGPQPQLWAFYLYLVLAAVVAGVFAWVAASSRRPREISAASVARLRVAFLVLLALVLAAALGLTLTRLPYDRFDGEVPDRVLFVAGKQFAFALSSSPIEDPAAWEALGGEPPVEVGRGELVELRVTTFDVNHGVGIYDPQGVLIGQVQAMPGYLNRLRLRLEEPGTYRLVCLELCGNGHPGMRGVLRVLPSGQIDE